MTEHCTSDQHKRQPQRDASRIATEKIAKIYTSVNKERRNSEKYFLFFSETNCDETFVQLPDDELFVRKQKMTESKVKSDIGDSSQTNDDQSQIRNTSSTDPIYLLQARLSEINVEFDRMKKDIGKITTTVGKTTSAINGMREELAVAQLSANNTEKKITQLATKMEGEISEITAKIDDQEKELTSQILNTKTELVTQLQVESAKQENLAVQNTEAIKQLTTMMQTLINRVNGQPTPSEMPEPEPRTTNDNTIATVINPSAHMTVKILRESGVEFTNTNIHHPHRHVRNFEKIAKASDVATEHRAVMFRGTVKATEANTWRDNSMEFTTYEDLRVDFLSTFWSIRRQEDAFRQFQVWKYRPNASLDDVTKELSKWSDTLNEMKSQTPSDVLRHIYAKLPPSIRQQIDYENMVEPGQLLARLKAIARKEDSIGTSIVPLDEVNLSNQAQTSLSHNGAPYVPPQLRNQNTVGQASTVETSNNQRGSFDQNIYQRRDNGYRGRGNNRRNYRQNQGTREWRRDGYENDHHNSQYQNYDHRNSQVYTNRNNNQNTGTGEYGDDRKTSQGTRPNKNSGSSQQEPGNER